MNFLAILLMALAINITSAENPPHKGHVYHRKVNQGEIKLTAAQWTQLNALYDGELHQNDTDLGRLWRALKERHIANSSVFVFSADHGEAFGEHPRQLVWHDLPYETILRVPLIIRMPRLFPAVRVHSAVRTIDIFPTLLEIVGGTLENPINGKSLISTMKNKAPDRPVIGASYYGGGIIFHRAENYKFFYSRRTNDRFEIYDLKADPEEQHNLFSKNPLLKLKMKMRLQQFLEHTRIHIAKGISKGSNEKALERLRSLGYVD